ncbi:sigma-54-dependent Fis family transcriptional regulator [Fulvivirga sp. M361]|uniref:sigma-54-dependent transcriptional regulator n=1 Tax=Fulvivirga sp. M361 TaxID=2594266 RepID=UPI00117B4127|nr:sigma-54 dependent transcriptional regulator [Fulvivirga sp. M361]TRX48807.1 sigma-54-dependent Fis family transcriptional regulator [Fulvivirga sp. M361]
MKKLLVIDDDASFNLMLKTFLSRFYHVDAAMNGNEGITQLKKQHYDMLITDLRLPDHYGLELLKEVQRTYQGLPVILMTGYADIKSAVEAMKLGAIDYISKPIDPEELLAIIKNALSADQEVARSVDPNNDHFLKTKSAASLKIQEHTDLVAPTEMSVIITGESGTGKEYVSRLIHDKSLRKDKPFVAVDCGALPKDIAGSELFGHVKGAFTGAHSDKIGCFEQADGGTLFLDEVGNLPYEIQVQLLRALQDRSIRKLGSNQTITVNVRIIAATNENLKMSMKEGEFREDLYHRLNEFSIEIPPLRLRGTDIPIFADYFLRMANQSLNKQVMGFSKAALNHLCQYAWPGNLRELKNVVKRAVLLTVSEVIQENDLPSEVIENTFIPSPDHEDEPYKAYDLKNITAHKEKELIESALIESRYNKSKAAKMLNIDRKTLYKKLKLFNIDS